jgi:phosphatidylserine decarboxylase
MSKHDRRDDTMRSAFLAALQADFEAYKKEVNGTEMAPSSKYTYNSMAEQFVRWCRDEFRPGQYVA